MTPFCLRWSWRGVRDQHKTSQSRHGVTRRGEGHSKFIYYQQCQNLDIWATEKFWFFSTIRCTQQSFGDSAANHSQETKEQVRGTSVRRSLNRQHKINRAARCMPLTTINVTMMGPSALISNYSLLDLVRNRTGYVRTYAGSLVAIVHFIHGSSGSKHSSGDHMLHN